MRVHRPAHREVPGLGAGAEDGRVGEGVRGDRGAAEHLLVGGEGLAREAVTQACGHEDVVGDGAGGAGGEGGGVRQQGGVGAVEGDEAAEEERVLGEAEGEGQRVQLQAQAGAGAVEVEEGDDGAEEEVGSGEQAAELGEGEDGAGEEARGGGGGEGAEKGGEGVGPSRRRRSWRRPWRWRVRRRGGHES